MEMLGAERWERVQSIFAQAADLPESRKRRFIEEHCGGDVLLAESVLALLAEDANGHSLLDGNLNEVAEEALRSDHLRSLVERQIGPYRLVRMLGEGGTGIVYLAQRADIGGLVAIKLLRDSWLSPMRRERFALEQQTLVKLNHPSIARLYDAGTTEDGTPWFVMEYADGQPLTEYLRTRGAGLRDNLLLFQRVCEAVQYAHAHAVVHRDLKPSNVLVTREGEVKLLDFGIAKQIAHEVNRTERTIAGLRLLTPGYAAPEQYSGDDVGVFTDVYSLGILLYEMLTGQLPDPEEARAGRLPARPSAFARNAGNTALSRRQWADLDVLCLKALEPEPGRRYGSVDALSRDISAYLDGRVLEARPNSLTYTAGKFIRRNRLALGSTAAGLLLLIAATVFFTVRLARARNAAVAEAARTERIQHFTENLFAGGDAGTGPSADMKVTELLDRGQTEAESLSQDPEMQADMLSTLGGVYQQLGRLDKAEALFQRAMALRRDITGTRKPRYAESLLALGLLRMDQRRMDDAEKLLRLSLALQQQAPPRDNLAIEHALWALGSVLSLKGNYSEARRLLEAAVKQGALSGAPTAQLADDYTQLGEVDFYTGDYDGSKELNQRALAIHEKLFGEHHPAVSENLNTLGQIAQNQTQYAMAESYFRRALAIDEAWYGPDHPKVAEDLTALSTPLIKSKQYEQARALLQRALDIQQRVHGPSHTAVALALNQLGVLASTQNFDDEAEKDFRAALAIWRNAYGEHHQFVGLSYANLAGVYIDRRDYPAAEAMCRKALQVYNSALSADNLNTACLHVKLGRVLLREHRFPEARVETLIGYQYLSSHVGPEDSYLLGAQKDLDEAQSRMGKAQ